MERSEQVRNLSTLSALVAGFAVASFLEFNFDVNDVPTGLAVAYATTTALVVRLAYCVSLACCSRTPLCEKARQRSRQVRMAPVHQASPNTDM